MITFITWIWGTKYGAHYITRLRNGVHRHYQGPHTFRVIEPPPGDQELLEGCNCRLRMFSPEWQASHGINEGDRFVCLDLDLIVTGPLYKVFDHSESFMILKGANAANPCPYNGSVMMLRGGAHPEVWSDFTLDAVRRVPRYTVADDQSWLWHKLPNAAGWNVGPASGIYAFRKPQWPPSDELPKDASIVAFPGKRDPSQFRILPWIRDHWG